VKAVLRDKLPVRHLIVHAEVAWFEQRPELGALCRAAIESRGVVDAELVQAMFPGLGEVGAENIRRWARALGLVKDSGDLTAWGRSAAENDRVAIPEEGVYSIWFVDHPLTGAQLLHIRRERMDWNRRLQDEVDTLPPGVPLKRSWMSVVEDGVEFRIYDFPAGKGESPVCVYGAESVEAELVWTLDFLGNANHWHLTGHLGRRFQSQDATYAGLDLPDLFGRWNREAGSAGEEWHPVRQRLLVRSAGLDRGERERFLADRTFSQVSVPGIGRFGEVKVEDIPLGPRDDAEAAEWARQLMIDRTERDGYRAWPEIRRDFGAVVLGTPLEEHDVSLPSADVLLAERDRADSRAAYWRLAAVLDLAPVPVPDWLRGELRLAKDGPEDGTPHDRGRVTIRMGERLDVTTVASRLTDGATPRRVILCDRYVRGNGNLRALTVFRDAVRCPIEVVTRSTDPEQRRAVERASGSRVRDYSEAFGSGSRELHDRYVVICPHQGHPYVWWMSNSILDVRLPDDAGPSTPGQWRELIAVRFRPEDVSPQVAALAREAP